MPRRKLGLDQDLRTLGEDPVTRYYLVGFDAGLGLNVQSNEPEPGVTWANGYPHDAAQGALLWLRSDADHRLDSIAVDYYLTPPLIRKPKRTYAEINGVARQNLDKYARRGFSKLAQALAYMRGNEFRSKASKSKEVRVLAVIARNGVKTTAHLANKISTNMGHRKKHNQWDV